MTLSPLPCSLSGCIWRPSVSPPTVGPWVTCLRVAPLVVVLLVAVDVTTTSYVAWLDPQHVRTWFHHSIEALEQLGNVPRHGLRFWKSAGNV